MDRRLFDSVTRSLAAPRTRRGLLGAVVAVAAGARAATAQSDCQVPGQTRNRKGDCSCPPGTTACATGCTNLRSDPANCGACGTACGFGEVCQKGGCKCPSGAVCGPPVSVVTGELTDGDPLAGGCLRIFRYDAHPFDHPGGPLSLGVRGVSSGGGTLPDPLLILFAGPAAPADFCASVVADDDDGCGLDAYLETTQPAGTYTAIIIDATQQTGSYTFERNTFTGGACPP